MNSARCWITQESIVCSIFILDKRTDVSGIVMEPVLTSSLHFTKSPSKLLVECLDSILPSLSDLFNSSLASGIFPQCFKSARFTPILIKRSLDHNDLKNYRPDSNLCFVAKIRKN